MNNDQRISDSSIPAAKPTGRFRAAKWVGLIVLLLIVIGAIVVYLGLNGIVKRVLVTQSSSSLNVPTSLGSANVSLLGGSVSLTQFEIGAPAGFKTSNMMSLGSLSVDVSLGELRQDPIRIASIDVSSPKLVIEMQGREFNIRKFMDQLPPTDPNAETIKLVIDELKVAGAQVVLRPDVQAIAALPGIGKNLSGLREEYVLTIPPISLKNIGTGEGSQNGAAIKEVVSLLVTELAAKATQSDQLPPELRQLLGLNVKDMAEMAKAKIGAKVQEQIGKISEDLTKGLPPDAAKELEGFLKNPQQATTNPAQAIEQGLGSLLQGKNKPAATTKAK